MSLCRWVEDRWTESLTPGRTIRTRLGPGCQAQAGHWSRPLAASAARRGGARHGTAARPLLRPRRPGDGRLSPRARAVAGSGALWDGSPSGASRPERAAAAAGPTAAGERGLVLAGLRGRGPGRRRHERRGGEADAGGPGEGDPEAATDGEAAEQAPVPLPARHHHGGWRLAGGRGRAEGQRPGWGSGPRCGPGCMPRVGALVLVGSRVRVRPRCGPSVGAPGGGQGRESGPKCGPESGPQVWVRAQVWAGRGPGRARVGVRGGSQGPRAGCGLRSEPEVWAPGAGRESGPR